MRDPMVIGAQHRSTDQCRKRRVGRHSRQLFGVVIQEIRVRHNNHKTQT